MTPMRTTIGIALSSAIAAAAPAQIAERTRIMAEDPAALDSFGLAVAVDGPIAVSGAGGAAIDGIENAGAIYLFDSFTGVQLFKLVAEQPTEGAILGVSVAIEGATVVGGAALEDADTGAVYTFDAATGRQLLRVRHDDPTNADKLGSSVDISGGRIVAGAPEHDGPATDAGAAYIFDAVTGAQLHKLLPDDPEPFTQFGLHVAISGSTVVVTDPRDETTGRVAGAVHVFDADTGQQRHKLVSPTVEDFAVFGTGLDIDGDRILVGAPGAAGESGRAYIFDANTGDLLLELSAPMPRLDFVFGTAVALWDGVAVIGEPEGFNTDVFYFDAETGELIAELTADRSSISDSFGRAIGAGPGSAIVGAFTDAVGGRDSGAAYLFDVVDDGGCQADCDGSGELDFFDFLCFQNLFAAGAAEADCDGSGSLDFFDFLCFQNLFAAGCP